MSPPSHWCGTVTASTSEVAARLGLDVRRRHLPGCPMCGVQKRGSGELFRGRDGKERWKCHRCGASGDAIDLVAITLVGTHFRELSAEHRQAVRTWFTSKGLADTGLWQLIRPGAESPRPSAPLPRPSRDALRKFCRSLVPVTADGEVTEFLSHRGLDPHVIAELGLAKALPKTADLPAWARIGGHAWTEGWRCIFPAYGATGRIESVRARWVRQEHWPPGTDKAAAPAAGTGSASGLVLANAAGRGLLHGEAMATASGDIARVAIAEGETDFLTQATRASRAGAPRCVLGLWNGSWTEEIASRIPDGARVAIRTDNDRDGDRYAEAAIRTLIERCIVLRKQPVEA